MAEARTRGAFPPLQPVAALRERTPTGPERRHLASASRTTMRQWWNERIGTGEGQPFTGSLGPDCAVVLRPS